MKHTKIDKNKEFLTPEIVIGSCSPQGKTSFRSVLKFYNSIPEYDDINHLNEHEFYSRLESLRGVYSKLKYGSDSTLSTDESNSSEDYSLETVKNSRKKCNRTPMSRLKVSAESTVKATDTVDSGRKKCSSTSMYKEKRQTKSVSPTRRTSAKSISKISLDTRKNLYGSPTSDDAVKPKGKKKRAGHIPLTSRVPIYDQIMEDQKQRSQIRKLESAIELQSKMKPFQFSTRTRSRCSSASAISEANCKKEKGLKLNSSTSTLNSSYFYSKKWEEEYFRRLNRMIRADELLKLTVSSPIGKKEAARPKSDVASCKFCTRKKSRKKTQGKLKDKSQQKLLDAETAEKKENLSETFDGQSSTALPIYPVARPNLAARLRAELVRKRVEKSSDSNEPSKPSSQADWGVRRTPAWKSLTYNETNDEDISFRLATRRVEQSLRQKEHALNMQLMRERVRAAPLLLEGTTYWSHRVGKVSHNCGKENCLGTLATYDKKRCIKSACSSRPEMTKFIKKKINSAIQKQNDSDDLESEDRAYL